jgi:DNA-directed RNA polymerase subunit alpha
MPIEKLELTPRAYNSLKRANISKVGEVLEMSEEELLAVRNFGKKSLDELHDRLFTHGLLAEASNSPLLRSSGSASLLGGADEEEEE